MQAIHKRIHLYCFHFVQGVAVLQAIAALGKALQADPGNPEALLSLGVSHTNELDQSRALTYLMEWLKAQPGQAGAASVQLPKDAREKLRVVVDIFRTAAQMVDNFPARRVGSQQDDAKHVLHVEPASSQQQQQAADEFWLFLLQ